MIWWIGRRERGGRRHGSGRNVGCGWGPGSMTERSMEGHLTKQRSVVKIGCEPAVIFIDLIGVEFRGAGLLCWRDGTGQAR
eukprot:360904-Chlamydomonas_euryale.AAC.2